MRVPRAVAAARRTDDVWQSRRWRVGGIAWAVALVAAGTAVVRGDDAAAPQAATSGSASAGGVVPYWQAQAVPQAVIQGGAIPAGWQPRAVPYQGIGPDGRPLTVYVAPTYVFTYQSGPPVLAVPPVNRPSPAQPTTSPAYGSYGWNYQSQGAPAVPVALPPATVARYQPAPYQFPPDARALSGTPIEPPATPLPGPTQPLAAPPPQWVPSNEPPPPGITPQPLAVPAPQPPPAAASPPPIPVMPVSPAPATAQPPTGGGSPPR